MATLIAVVAWLTEAPVPGASAAPAATQDYMVHAFTDTWDDNVVEDPPTEKILTISCGNDVLIHDSIRFTSYLLGPRSGKGNPSFPRNAPHPLESKSDDVPGAPHWQQVSFEYNVTSATYELQILNATWMWRFELVGQCRSADQKRPRGSTRVRSRNPGYVSTRTNQVVVRTGSARRDVTYTNRPLNSSGQPIHGIQLYCDLTGWGPQPVVFDPTTAWWYTTMATKANVDPAKLGSTRWVSFRLNGSAPGPAGSNQYPLCGKFGNDNRVDVPVLAHVAQVSDVLTLYCLQPWIVPCALFHPGETWTWSHAQLTTNVGPDLSSWLSSLTGYFAGGTTVAQTVRDNLDESTGPSMNYASVDYSGSFAKPDSTDTLRSIIGNTTPFVYSRTLSDGSEKSFLGAFVGGHSRNIVYVESNQQRITTGSSFYDVFGSYDAAAANVQPHTTYVDRARLLAGDFADTGNVGTSDGNVDAGFVGEPTAQVGQAEIVTWQGVPINLKARVQHMTMPVEGGASQPTHPGEVQWVAVPDPVGAASLTLMQSKSQLCDTGWLGSGNSETIQKCLEANATNNDTNSASLYQVEPADNVLGSELQQANTVTLRTVDVAGHGGYCLVPWENNGRVYQGEWMGLASCDGAADQLFERVHWNGTKMDWGPADDGTFLLRTVLPGDNGVGGRSQLYLDTELGHLSAGTHVVIGRWDPSNKDHMTFGFTSYDHSLFTS